MAKILIAEDERDIRELIEFTLTAYAGHEVFKAANGQEAVEMAPTVMPDLIMMDVRMPKMTGYEACRELKKIDTVKDIPVVFLSAKGQESEIDTGLDAGAYDYILKPFAPDQLATRVAEILQKFRDSQKAAAASAPATPDAATTPATPAAPANLAPASPATATTPAASTTGGSVTTPTPDRAVPPASANPATTPPSTNSSGSQQS
jgi:DNA-binding response OmpR family regulator